MMFLNECVSKRRGGGLVVVAATGDRAERSSGMQKNSQKRPERRKKGKVRGKGTRSLGCSQERALCHV